MRVAADNVLILAEEPIIAALLGLLIELSGSEPRFANAGEAGDSAIRRIDGLRAVFIDSAAARKHFDLVIIAAAERGTRIVIFGPEGDARQIAELAGEHQAAWVIVPPDWQQVALAIGAASGSRRQSDRRQSPRMAVVADGTAILTDDVGCRWMVYDRRGSTDRRSAGDQDRVFVSEDGELRHIAVASTDVAERTAPVLADQLRRSIVLT